jgi:hypothetical protein
MKKFNVIPDVETLLEEEKNKEQIAMQQAQIAAQQQVIPPVM